MTHSQNIINCFNTTLKVIKTWDYPAGNYMFKVNNRNTRTRCEIFSKLTIKTPERQRIYDLFKYLHKIFLRNYQLGALIRKLTSKHKSEVLSVKIQFKVKFPQVVITKIRTLPLVFRKSFRTTVWRKTRDSCFWHYVWKTINLCGGKVALCALHHSSWRIKCYCSQRNSMGTDRENIVPGNLSWKQMLGIDKKIVTYTIFDI